MSAFPSGGFSAHRFHHWHHAVRPLDKNFAIHLPVIDRIFGTHYLPEGQWPDAYGIDGGPVPERYPGQVLYPFRRLVAETR